MIIVNIHEAKTQLSKLVAKAANGESFIIAKAGKPLVKVVAIKAKPKPSRFDFLKGELKVPDDFDRRHEAEILRLFEGNDE